MVGQTVDLPILTADIKAEYGDVRPLDKAQSCTRYTSNTPSLSLSTYCPSIWL